MHVRANIHGILKGSDPCQPLPSLISHAIFEPKTSLQFELEGLDCSQEGLGGEKAINPPRYWQRSGKLAAKSENCLLDASVNSRVLRIWCISSLY